jgi:hypothetical protein
MTLPPHPDPSCVSNAGEHFPAKHLIQHWKTLLSAAKTKSLHFENHSRLSNLFSQIIRLSCTFNLCPNVLSPSPFKAQHWSIVQCCLFQTFPPCHCSSFNQSYHPLKHATRGKASCTNPVTHIYVSIPPSLLPSTSLFPRKTSNLSSLSF